MRDELKARRKALSGRLFDLTDGLVDAAHDLAPQIGREGHPADKGAPVTAPEAGEPPPLSKSSEAEIAGIRAALARMDRGEYGICIGCGEAISSDRLDVLPFTPYCRHCAHHPV